MHAIGRRTFLSLAAASAVPSFARTLNVIGVQLYTVRTVLPQDPLKVLRALEQIGYREAELNMDNLDGVFPALKQTSLKPVSLHLDSNRSQRLLGNAFQHSFRHHQVTSEALAQLSA